MGNHVVGKTMSLVIESALLYKEIETFNQLDAIKLFDLVGKNYEGLDAEFDDLFIFGSDGYKLLCKAFYPELLERFKEIPSENSSDFRIWDEMFYECYSNRFCKKYKYC